MKKTHAVKRERRSVAPYTYRGCVMTRNRSAWCYRICSPNRHGIGACGRIAPHSLKSSTQLAIEKYMRDHPLPGTPRRG